MKEAFERPIAESNNGQKRNELEFYTLKILVLYACCIIIIYLYNFFFFFDTRVWRPPPPRTPI